MFLNIYVSEIFSFLSPGFQRQVDIKFEYIYNYKPVHLKYKTVSTKH